MLAMMVDGAYVWRGGRQAGTLCGLCADDQIRPEKQIANSFSVVLGLLLK